MSRLVAPGVGSVLAGRYELTRFLARGGMADVYEARDLQLQRLVAVELSGSAASGDRVRFDAEVQVLAALNHPGLVPVYDAGELDDDAFVVLELIEGPTLAARLAERGVVRPAEVAVLGSQVADALAYVHQQGVVHRDVTPSNILCGPDGRPRLADFGIARLVDTTRVTATAMTVGTAAYMAPEQVQGRDVTPAADVYSLGLVLLELLTGRRAFEGAPHEVATARLARPPDTTGGVPEAWQSLLRAMTEREVEDRPSAAAAAAQLRNLAGASTGAVASGATIAGAGVVSGYTETRAIPVASSTTPMPAVLVPNPEPDPPSRQPWLETAVAAVARHKALAIAVAFACVVLLGIASAGDDVPLPPATTPTSEVRGADLTTTTVPTTTSEPDEEEGEGNGRGNGNGKGKDDD